MRDSAENPDLVTDPRLGRLSQQLQASLEPHRVLSTTARVVAEALRARYAGVYLKRLDAEGLILVTEHPPVFRAARAAQKADAGRRHELLWTDFPPPHALTFDMVHHSEVVGHLVVVPDDGRRPTEEEHDLLGMIARRAGSAAQAVRQAQDLIRARERLVLAREEERRRLRRNLHDTIGPTLAALSLKASTVRDLIPRDPSAAQDQMNELREQINSVITDIRRVVYDLRPPALDELGMVPAIREQARQFSTGGLRVVVDAPDEMLPLPAAVEVAAYRIVVEALTNVARHARARLCRIRLDVDDHLEIEVADDGIGLPADLRAGVGIASMRERVAELGGSCAMESPPGGGARVLASLPIASQGLGWEREPSSADDTGSASGSG